MSEDMKQVEFILDIVSKALDTGIKVFDSETGEVKLNGTSYEDLGDYIPFILFYGKNEIAEREVQKTVAELRRSRFVFTKDQPGVAGCFARAYDQSDLIWGLQLAARHDPDLNPYIDEALDAFWASFWNGSGVMMRLTRLPLLGLAVPQALQPKLRILSAEDHGMFIELYAHQYQVTGQARHLNRAWAIYESFTATPTFRQNGFFPFFTPSGYLARNVVRRVRAFNKRSGQFLLLKQNSNTLWGIFKLQATVPEDRYLRRVIESTIDKWIDLFMDHDTGVFYTSYDCTDGRRSADLTSFHIIELLVESAHRFGRTDHLDYAACIADSFLAHQSATTGLVPFLHPAARQELPRFGIREGVSWLDSTVDFAIAILKLGLVSGRQDLIDSFERILNGVTRYHRRAEGYASSVAVEDGTLVEAVYSTKMTALILKLFIARSDMDNIFNTGSDTHFALLDR